MNVKVRIAPSPTGNLHIGTARTALFNWLFARHHGGEFIVRIEDTDIERSKPEFEQNIVDGLKWLGLDWDNESLIRQSERLPVYRKYLEQMLADGSAYWRVYTEAEQVEMTREGRTARDRVICLTEDENPLRAISFHDEIRGDVSVEVRHIGQVVLAKDLDTPLYNFAVVVDDVDMEITDVIRGEDHISNTPKQLLIYEALHATPPRFAHLPLILGSDKSKMSKRHGATNIADYQRDYLPDALINFMGLLGYTYEPELLSREEMIAQFDLKKVHKSGAIFDERKLNWMNAQYIRQLSTEDFKRRTGLHAVSDQAVPLIVERLEKLTDTQQFRYLWEATEYDSSLLRWKQDSDESTIRALTACRDLALQGSLNSSALDQLAVNSFVGSKGSVYWPLRVALSGSAQSAGPLDIAVAIGSEQTMSRIQAALRALGVEV